jgi:acyl carrier protein
MTDSIEIRVRQIAADIFNMPLDRVTPETSLDGVKNWDSVQHLNFVLALEQSLGITLEPEDIDQIRSVGAAIDVVRKICGKF